MPWPSMMPEDLRRRVNDVIHRRNVEAADVWTELRDWLIKHGVEAPDLTPPGPQPRDAAATRDQ